MGKNAQIASRSGRGSPVHGPDFRLTGGVVRQTGTAGVGLKIRPGQSVPWSLRLSYKRLVRLEPLLILMAAGFCLSGVSVRGQDPPHLPVIVPGGFPGMPLMTGAANVTNGVSVTWYGPPGYYQLYQAPTLVNPAWQTLGGLNLSNNAIVAKTGGKAFFRVAGASPQYAGSQTCADCHAEVLNTQIHTAHAGAFSNPQFVSLGGNTNAACYTCHTVGAGLPTGFRSQALTPQLAGVQCENCHGPAARHAANPDDPTLVPRVELAATVCGGCHNAQYAPSAPAPVAALHPPRYEEWNTSAHRAVLSELQADFISSANNIANCGYCHSGTVREALVEGQPLPDAHEAGAVGIACATCHDSHQIYVHTNVLNGVVTNAATGVVVTNTLLGAVYTNQIANPLASLQDYHAVGSFTNTPNVNVCAQCHNDRGASTNTTSRPPHHSPQYNMLLGTFKQSDTGVPSSQPGTHAVVEKQCVTCHMPTAASPGPGQPAISGHQFEVVTYDACAECHGSAANGEGLAAFLQSYVASQIQYTRSLLNQWATTKAPAGLAGYGILAWEYTTPGDLSTGGPGPNAAQQALIPAGIQQARFDLYLVFNDGSQGVHNPFYTLDLLTTAQGFVQQELNK
jgi:hypothetical protein